MGVFIKLYRMASLVFMLIAMVVFIPFLGESQALESNYGKGHKYEVPVREISLIATPEGYYPKDFSVFAGEKVKFFLTNTGNTPSCFMLPEKEIFLSAQKGHVSEGSAFFSKPGVYKFYCPTGKIKGHMTVLPRPKSEEELEAERRIASERNKTKVRIWYPREE